MKILINEVLQFLNFYSSIADKKISLPLAYKLAKGVKNLNIEKDFYQEKFNQYLDLYAEKDKDGQYIQQQNNIKIKKDKISECNQKMKELNNLEVDIQDLYFTLDELNELELSPNEMSAFLPFIRE